MKDKYKKALQQITNSDRAFEAKDRLVGTLVRLETHHGVVRNPLCSRLLPTTRQISKLQIFGIFECDF